MYAKNEEYKHKIQEFLNSKSEFLGRAALKELEGSCKNICMLGWEEYLPPKQIKCAELDEQFKHEMEKIVQEHEWKALFAERDDDIARMSLVEDRQKLVEYAAYWEKRLRKIPLKGISVKGIPKSELIEELIFLLTEQILVDIRENTPPLAEYERIGREASYVFLMKAKDRLKNSLPDKGECLPFKLGFIAPPEELIIMAEKEQSEEAVIKHLKDKLTTPQKKWLNAFLENSSDCTFSDGRINPSKVAARIGMNSHSGSKAFRRLGVQAHRMITSETKEVIS